MDGRTDEYDLTEVQQAIEQIELLYQGLDALRADILSKNPRNFAVLAEGPLDEIRKLQADIESIYQPPGTRHRCLSNALSPFGKASSFARSWQGLRRL